jgi:DUF2075 family protein
MLVYQADKRRFLHDSENHDIEEFIHERYLALAGRRVAPGERRAWRESLAQVAKLLRAEAIAPDIGVGVELFIPLSAKRIDVVLSGLDASMRENIVIIELKQWERVKSSGRDAIVLTWLGGAERPEVHPSYQAWSYAMLLEGFNEVVHTEGVRIHPCAYLHNYVRDGVIDAQEYSDYVERAPLFLRGDAERERLRSFVVERVLFGDAGVTLQKVAASPARPSKTLADALTGLLRGNPEFVLVDDQKQVFEAAAEFLAGASAAQRRVAIVEGGPGTGKSLVAVNLLVALTGRGLLCRYVSKNAAPRRVYEARLAGTMRRSQFANLFGGSGNFIEAEPGTFDVLVVDEAHRLNEKSGLYGNLGEHQVREIIAAAKGVVFFIDEDQRISLDDVGSKELIEQFAAQVDAQVQCHALASQFRCSGSDGYLAWLDDVLGIRETANSSFERDRFDFQVFETPDALHAAIEEKNVNNRARVVAGYCWRWASRRNPLAWDIVIGETYRRRWNLDRDGSLWIVTPGSVSEVGCIHTCQGLEVEYIGVIIGPDFVVRQGVVQTVARARDRHDKTMKGYVSWRRIDPREADRAADLVIRNTYRTLMTRGMKGCYLYCTDAETAAYFRQCLAMTNYRP